MAPPAETRVFLEVRRRLQSALLILGEPKEGGMPMDISITPSSLQVKTPGGCTEICLPAEVRLVPSSSRGLQYVAGDGLHLRLQAWAEFSTQLTSMFNQSSEAQDCCTFYCQSCGEVIIRDSFSSSKWTYRRPRDMKKCSQSLIIRDANQKDYEISPHTCQNGCHQQMISSGEDVEKKEPSCTTGGNADWCSHYGKRLYLLLEHKYLERRDCMYHIFRRIRRLGCIEDFPGLKSHLIRRKIRKLLRVLPLPTENWGALVGEWCCHPDPFANKPLHPRENDCFIGDSFFLVNLRSDTWQPSPQVAPEETHCLSSENHFKSKPKANTKVICKRCKVTLGETMSSETIKFYMTEVIMQPSERNFPIIPRSQFVQSTVAQCLVELSSARSTFRFSVQGHDGKPYILLWLLNSDSVVIESLASSRSVKKFPLLEDILKADSSSARNAVKVLYQPCIKSRNEKLVSSWESDISVYSLTLPSATCLELLLILSRNNATLPPSLRCMNSFQVAFLKM